LEIGASVTVSFNTVTEISHTSGHGALMRINWNTDRIKLSPEGKHISPARGAWGHYQPAALVAPPDNVKGGY